MIKIILVAIALIPVAGSSACAQDWEAAEKGITRLAPDKYPQLPLKIRKNLRKRGCSIPQCFDTSRPHNVVKGSFLRKGQEDWGVLCSSGGVSSILIFPGGSVENVVARETMPDKNFLQGMGEDRIVYSRILGVFPEKAVLKDAGPDKLAAEAHDGIVDAFAEKGSSVLYFDKDKWIDLPGAD